jgi:hypothetical protein
MKENFFRILFEDSKKYNWVSEEFINKSLDLIAEKNAYLNYLRYSEAKRDFAEELISLSNKYKHITP